MIEIYGKEYEIKYPINTLCMMADDGIDVMNISDMKINIATIRDLFYYGLKHENKRITKNQAGDLIDDYIAEGHVFGELMDIIMEALGKSLGRKDDDGDKNEAEDEGK